MRRPAFALLAATELLGACATSGPSPSYVLQDFTVARAPAVPPDSPAAEASPQQRLTLADRIRVEHILGRLARASGPPNTITVQVVPTGAEVTQGGKITISSTVVLWALRDVGNEYPAVGEAYLAYVLAHEIGHMISPKCFRCADMQGCEEEVDENAQRILKGAGYSVFPRRLERLVNRGLDAVTGEHLQALKACESSPGRNCAPLYARAACECFATASVFLRYVELQYLEVLPRRADSWKEHQGIVSERRQYERDRTKTLPALSGICAEWAKGLANPVEAPSCCLVGQGETVDRAVNRLPGLEVPSEGSPLLWSEKVLWQDHATWLVEGFGGPSWGDFRSPALGRGWGLMVGAVAMMEEGRLDGPGLRLGYGRFGVGPEPVERFTAELVARDLQTLGNRFAFIVNLGVGAVWVRSGSTRSTSFLASLDGRYAFSPIPRLDLGLGVGYSLGGKYDSSRGAVVTNQVFAAHLTLDVHFGIDIPLEGRPEGGAPAAGSPHRAK